MQIGITFQKGETWFPAKSMEIGFRQLPTNWLSFDVKAFQALNLFYLPSLEGFVMGIINSSMKDMMLLPEMLKINMGTSSTVTKVSKKEKKTKKKKKGETTMEVITECIVDPASLYK